MANVGIENGGAFLTSKSKIYKLLNDHLIPKTLLIDQKSSIDEVVEWVDKNEINYPIIVKPDYGLRGYGIEILKSELELYNFFEHLEQSYLIQEFVDYENEIGVFLLRQDNGDFIVSSIVERQFVSLLGDGVRNIEELILAEPRYAMQYDYLVEQKKGNLSTIPEKGSILNFDRIGNHSKGTIFKNGNYLISDQLTKVMSQTVSNLKFSYGRLDIKYKSLVNLLNGLDYKIIELNGVFSEPAHIYEPGTPLFRAWKVLLFHFRSLYEISYRSIQSGNKPDSFYSGVIKVYQHMQLTKRMR